MAWLLLAIVTIFGHILGEDLELCGDVVVSDQLRAGAAIARAAVSSCKLCTVSPLFLYTIININAQMVQYSPVFAIQLNRFTGVRYILGDGRLWWSA